MAGISILRNLLLKQAIKESGQASGIMSIGDSVRKLAERRLESYLISAAKKNIDLDKFSESQIKYMLEMNNPYNKAKMSLKKEKGIKSADVFDLKGRKLDKDKPIMGGTQDDLDKKADGGRIGLFAGSVPKIFKLLKNPKKVKQAIDNIFPTGDVKYDATMAAESLVELNPKIFGNKLYDDLDSMTRLDIYDAVISPMMSAQAKALRMKRASKPTKTLEGIEKTGKINISDPEVAEEFARFMRETSPGDAKKLEQTLELDASY